MNNIQEFYQLDQKLESQWRAILLFGRNTTSYKFALAKSLAEISLINPNEFILLDDLALPFSQNLCLHIKDKSKQGTVPSSQFLDMCRLFNDGKIDENKLREETVKRGFNNVLDAFHIVNGNGVPNLFFIDERKKNKGIRLTENFYYLFERESAQVLAKEAEARWRLLEEAWALNISAHLINIKYDEKNNLLFSESNGSKRTNITSSRDALNGYQKSKCFYCYCDVDIISGSDHLADIDHFLPHSFLKNNPDINENGIWNLVLACKKCNSEKSAKIPSLVLLKRLHTRNEYLISSHHPLRETILRQTGFDIEARRNFLQNYYNQAINDFIHTWEPRQHGKAIF